ncbi:MULTISPECIES: hypothetical protein [Cryobacterium]|uniref:hypothetical protein n=1 Tax=Cryobacterium TaxID=69578 RepID=UPI00141AFF62|nr:MULTISPECIES: hypothetical protein [Cryobacterium]MEB0003001.1 hypothetical protein [Cryobacterium sp. RTC2.1]MEB0288106.1 hypothetical protein [Cryobacterium sp. 10S3]MEB0304694.1 hypothetical protein [Cryobacterium sp. 10I1]WPX13075.1 hypothetical protein RHM57_15570 [Cryobacterium sp. 10S3]
MLRTALRSRISRTSHIAIEAGRGDAWFRRLDLDGRVVSIEEFSASTALHISPELVTS